MVGLPRRPSNARDFTRDLQLAPDVTARISYTAPPGKKLPFGQDRFVLAGIIHFALQAGSPDVGFEQASDLLRLFGIPTSDGCALERLRNAFRRLSGVLLSIRIVDRRPGALDQERYRLLIEDADLPKRVELRAGNRAPSSTVYALSSYKSYRGSPFGVRLGARFWAYLQDRSTRLLLPAKLLQRFIDRPMGWDFFCFLAARCGAARTYSVVPHEALMHLFRTTGSTPDRNVIYRLMAYRDEIHTATGGRLHARFTEAQKRQGSRGRPSKRWNLQVGPSRPLLAASVQIGPGHGASLSAQMDSRD